MGRAIMVLMLALVTALAFPGSSAVQAQAPTDTAAAAVGGDPYRDLQWALDVLDAETAWQEQTAEGVSVAVLDTGIEANHPDLAAVVPGFDALGTTAGLVDPNGHGTSVAGVIGATIGNGVGIAGMAPNVTLLPVRVLDEFRTGTVDDVEAGIRFAIAEGADVINLSFGSTQPAPGVRAAIDDATLAGAVVVASAGNSFAMGNAPRYPAADSDVISAAAVGRDLKHAPFSTTHPTVDVAAPGVDIVMTAPGASYVFDEGTSFAAPYVSATAALVKARYPRATAAQVVERVVASARDLPPSGPDDVFGHGLLQPVAALRWQPDAGCQTVAFDPLMRVWDDNRIQTSAAAACTFWPAKATRHVVLATSRTYPDALAGTPLAALLEAPLLLTDPLVLTDELRQVLVQLGVEQATILGGEGAVSRQIDAALADMGIDVERIGGANRFDTAARIAERVGSSSNRAIVVSGSGFADAVAAGAYAAADAPPVLLTRPDGVPPETAAALSALGADDVVVVGGPSAVSTGVVNALEALAGGGVRRVAGEDRYATSAAVVADVAVRTDAGDDAAPLILATGAAFPDALAAGALAAQLDAALLLVRPGQPQGAAAVVGAGPWSAGALLGGPAAISAADAAALTASFDGAGP